MDALLLHYDQLRKKFQKKKIIMTDRTEKGIDRFGQVILIIYEGQMIYKDL